MKQNGPINAASLDIILDQIAILVDGGSVTAEQMEPFWNRIEEERARGTLHDRMTARLNRNASRITPPTPPA